MPCDRRPSAIRREAGSAEGAGSEDVLADLTPGKAENKACQQAAKSRIKRNTGLWQILFNRCWLTVSSMGWPSLRLPSWAISAGCAFGRSAKHRDSCGNASATAATIGVTCRHSGAGACASTAGRQRRPGVISGWTRRVLREQIVATCWFVRVAYGLCLPWGSPPPYLPRRRLPGHIFLGRNIRWNQSWWFAFTRLSRVACA
jgi:hypothetical protein